MPSSAHTPNLSPAPSASFDSLPIEIISQISSYFDKATSLSFARVSRWCTPLAAAGIWKRLDVSLPVHYGKFPRVQPAETFGRPEACSWGKQWAEDAEDRHRKTIKHKVDTIVSQGTDARWRLVEEVQVMQRTRAANGIIKILECAAPYVKALTMAAPEAMSGDSGAHALDTKLLRRAFHFPFLSSLTLRNGSVIHPTTVLLLCESSPLLLSLDAELTLRREYLPAPVPNPRNPRGLALSRLRLAGRPPGRGSENIDLELLLQLVTRSPRLERLSAAVFVADRHAIGPVVRKVLTHRALEELDLPLGMGQFNFFRSQAGVGGELEDGGMRRVRIVRLQHRRGYKDLLDNLVELPAMETLFLTGRTSYDLGDFEDAYFGRQDRLAHTRHPDAPAHPTLPPTFAEKLRNSPRLHRIYVISDTIIDRDEPDIFDRLAQFEQSGEHCAGQITSLRHHGHEILHVRLRLPFREISDEPSDADYHDHRDYMPIYYGPNDSRSKIFVYLPQLEWQEYYDFDGVAVPKEVFDRVRDVEGLLGEEKRGEEVGDAAWAILTEWMEAREQEI